MKLVVDLGRNRHVRGRGLGIIARALDLRTSGANPDSQPASLPTLSVRTEDPADRVFRTGMAWKPCCGGQSPLVELANSTRPECPFRLQIRLRAEIATNDKSALTLSGRCWHRPWCTGQAVSTACLACPRIPWRAAGCSYYLTFLSQDSADALVLGYASALV